MARQQSTVVPFGASPSHRPAAAYEERHKRSSSRADDILRRPGGWAVALALLVLLVFLLRARYFGNPLIDVDEQFYLLVGDRMLHGAVPFVDIWDRKPIGLFLLYAGIRSLGGDGVIQYQMVATGFCAATAVVIALIARSISSPRAALVVALAYAPALAMSGGMGGQAPVFYNLPMALAALLVTRLLGKPVPLHSVWRTAPIVMLLAGVAVQIKYTAVFEGTFFALALGWIAWRSQRGWGRLVEVALWGMLLILPTVAAGIWYAAHGWAAPFIFANFTSILHRGDYDRAAGDLAMIGIRLLPFILVIAMGEWLLAPFKAASLHREGPRLIHRFAAGWLAVAVAAFLGFGTFFDHYALPLLVPLTIAAAPTVTIGFRAAGPVFAAILLAAVFLPYPIDAARRERVMGNKATADRLAAMIRARLGGGCLYVFYGDPILYKTTNSCLPTKWAFPFHLSLARETPALGVNAVAEVDRIMHSRPTVVVDTDTDDDQIDPRTRAALRGWLPRRYDLIGRVPLAHSTTLVWALRPGATGTRQAASLPFSPPID